LSQASAEWSLTVLSRAKKSSRGPSTSTGRLQPPPRSSDRFDCFDCFDGSLCWSSDWLRCLQSDIQCSTWRPAWPPGHSGLVGLAGPDEGARGPTCSSLFSFHATPLRLSRAASLSLCLGLLGLLAQGKSLTPEFLVPTHNAPNPVTPIVTALL